MPKKRIPPEIKAQIIQFIKENPQISNLELKQKFNVEDGRVLPGLKAVALGRIVGTKSSKLESQNNIPEQQKISEPQTTIETEKKN